MQELIIGQLMNFLIRVWQMRRITGGNKKLAGCLQMLCTKFARQLKRDQTTHAVTEKRERLIEQWLDVLCKVSHHARHVVDDGFIKTRSPAGIMNGNSLDVTRKVCAPFGEGGRSTARVWEEEEA